jgi:glucose-1-phosphate adenylyltransferase
MNNVLSIILGGGQGTRLYPLTHRRSKPAVPIGGKYRLIDIPVSNCLHAELRRLFVLTQFNSASLNRHVGQTYRLDNYSQGFVEILAAEQTPENANWFQGTADAVRRGMPHFIDLDADYYLILAGDHLYRMNFVELVEAHVKAAADITIAAQPVPMSEASSMGIFRFDRHGRIEAFEEKPNAARLEEMVSSVPPNVVAELALSPGAPFVASMGIYVFSRDVLIKVLEQQTAVDFGREIIPKALGQYDVHSYYFRGYWADVGTMGSFYDANIMLTQPDAPFSFYDPARPIFTRSRFLPPSWVDGCTMRHAIVAEGAHVTDATVEASVIGVRTQVGRGARIMRSVVLGADRYDHEDRSGPADANGMPHMGIGEDCVLDGVIVDKNARIGAGSHLANPKGIDHADGAGYVIRDGIVVVPKDGVVAPGTRVEGT